MSKIYHNESGYLELLSDTLNKGVIVPSERTGTSTIALFDAKLVYDEDVFPFSTVTSAPLRLAFEEFWFFLKGRTQTKELEEKGINFWKGNTSREFLDSRGLEWLPEGSMGAGYGFQLRNYNKNLTEDHAVVDQLEELIYDLQITPFGRRHYVTMWNPSASDYMALTPCWHSHQFVVLPDNEGNKVLHLKLINRSLDILFGCRFAVQQYRLYQMCLAKMLGFKVGKLSCDLTHVHIYENQIEYIKETLERDYHKETYPLDSVKINKEINNLEDLLSIQWSDIIVDEIAVNTTKYKTPRPEMVA